MTTNSRTLLLMTVVVNLIQLCASMHRRQFPTDAFPEPDFDPNAPNCIPDREPCGFYSFGHSGKIPFKWVRSWCKCSDSHQCVFDRTDMRMRVFRQVCISADAAAKKEEGEDDGLGADNAVDETTTKKTHKKRHLAHGHHHHHHHHNHHHHGNKHHEYR